MAANNSGVTRKAFLRGLGAAGAGGLIVGAAGGYAGGAASSSSSSSSGKSSGSKSPIVLGSGVPVTGLYSGAGRDRWAGEPVPEADLDLGGRGR
ncbi:MAG: hypothetical protein ACYCO9_10310 [Streptosporangiaceae bacterium]